MKYIVDIQETYCEYIKDTPVIYIDKVALEYGKLYFVLGKSGAGKSTFLEAIGLMNNTFTSEASKVIFNTPKKEVSLQSIWNDESKISEFRRDYLTFIFQSTNLMDSFTAGENMAFCMMYNGASLEEVKPIVLNYMKELDLSEDLFDSKVQYVSGGQRQRLAFIRAITAPYMLLLGDEPTGNLDEIMADKLMSLLKAELIEKQKTGVIVSHNIELALQHADQVFYVLKKSISPYGRMGEQYAINKVKADWVDHNGQVIINPYEFLKKMIS